MKRPIQFSIRAFLILTAIIAVVCAFPMSRAMKQASARKWVAQQRGHVTFSHKYDRQSRTYNHTAQLAVPSWLVAWFGIDLFDTVDNVILDNQTVDDLRPIVGFSNLRSLGIYIEIDKNLDFSPLAELNRLEILDLKYTDISEERFQRLRQLLPDVSVTTDNLKPLQ